MQQKRKALKAMQRKFAALQERLKNELAALDTTEARVRHLDGLRKVGSARGMKLAQHLQRQCFAMFTS